MTDTFLNWKAHQIRREPLRPHPRSSLAHSSHASTSMTTRMIYKALLQFVALEDWRNAQIPPKPTKSATFHIWKVTPFQRALRQTRARKPVSQPLNFGFSPSVSINYRHASQHVRGSSPDIQQPGAMDLLQLRPLPHLYLP